jgi:hypothetical protein
MVDWQHYMTHAEVDAMQNLAGELPSDAYVVKIGAGAGTDTIAILEVTQDVVIFSIDILAGESPATTNEHLRLIENGYDQSGCVIRIWGDSKVVGKRWPLSINWLHIDGDHTKEGIAGDILEWYRHVMPAGFISFHDYGDPKWPAVKEVVDFTMSKAMYLPEYSADMFRVYQKT